MAENTETTTTADTLTEEQKQELANNGRSTSGSTRPDPKKIEDEGEPDPKDKTKEEKPTDKQETEEEKKAREDKEQKNEDGTWKDEYVKIDNQHAAAAIDLLKEAGVSPVDANDMFAAAIKANDLNKVDWARMEKRIGASKTALVKAGVTQYYNEEYSKQHETVQKGHEMFGGEEGWNKVAKHFQTEEKKDPALKAKLNGIRGALDVGGYAAEMALRELKTMYDADPRTKSVNTKQHERGDRQSTTADTEYVSAKDYRVQYAKLLDQGDYQAAEELSSRRAASIRQERSK